MAKVQKTLNLPVDVAVALEEEDNQSETAEAALRKHLGVPVDD